MAYLSLPKNPETGLKAPCEILSSKPTYVVGFAEV